MIAAYAAVRGVAVVLLFVAAVVTAQAILYGMAEAISWTILLFD